MHARQLPNSRTPGFTMLETVMVTVVIGIMVLMLIPMVRKSADSWRARQAAGLVAVDLESAFSLAGRERTPVRLTCYCDQQRYVLTDRAKGTILLERKLGPTSEYAMKTLAFSSTTIDIFPPGSSSSSLTVTLTTGSGATHQITMSQAGLVRQAN